MTTPISNLSATMISTAKWIAQNQQIGSDYLPLLQSTNIIAETDWGTSAANNVVGGADEFVSYLIQITGGSSTTIDLLSLTNILQQSGVALGDIKGIQIRLLSTTDDAVYGTAASSIAVGNATTSAWRLNNLSASATLAIKNGGVYQYKEPSAAGLTVDSTHFNLKVLNNDGSVTACVQVTLVGGSTTPVATHYSVTGVSSIVAGASTTLTVTALRADDLTDTAYAGTVHLTSNDGIAVLGANNTLASGVGTFTAQLKTAGTKTVTATDTVTGSITGSKFITVTVAAPALMFVTAAGGTATAGVARNISVQVTDSYANAATNYTGTVHFTSSDGAAVLPINTTLTSGNGTFSVTLNTVGTKTVTGVDTVTATITGTSNNITVT